MTKGAAILAQVQQVLKQSSIPVQSCSHNHGAYEEGNEGKGRQGHDQRCSYQDTCRAARVEDEGVLRAPRELGNPCHNRSEEERHLHNSRPLQDQDPCEASHQGGSAYGLWAGDQSESKASQDRCQGLRCRRTEVADLSCSLACLLWESQRLAYRGNPTDRVWASQLLCRRRMCQ